MELSGDAGGLQEAQETIRRLMGEAATACQSHADLQAQLASTQQQLHEHRSASQLNLQVFSFSHINCSCFHAVAVGDLHCIGA